VEWSIRYECPAKYVIFLENALSSVCCYSMLCTVLHAMQVELQFGSIMRAVLGASYHSGTVFQCLGVHAQQVMLFLLSTPATCCISAAVGKCAGIGVKAYGPMHGVQSTCGKLLVFQLVV
jgi:hypothetical protein